MNHAVTFSLVLFSFRDLEMLPQSPRKRRSAKRHRVEMGMLPKRNPMQIHQTKEWTMMVPEDREEV
jgi:hypothetical protein